jgi:hypothetical protein
MGRSISKDLRDRVKAKYPGRCGYCGVETQKIHIDHIKAVAHGGTDHIDNFCLAMTGDRFATRSCAQIATPEDN